MSYIHPSSQTQAYLTRKNRSTYLKQFVQYFAISHVALLSPLLMAEAASDNAATSRDVAEYSISVGLNSIGIGISTSGNTGWHIKEGDQIQWRAVIAGIDADDVDNIEFDDVEYENGELKTMGFQFGLDWYPYQQGWAKQVFFSTGLLYADIEVNGTAETNKSFNIGGQQVNPGDITSLTTSLDDTDIAPYLSVGWGNKLTGRRGFKFHAELGITPSTSNADVKLTAVDPGNVLSAANLAKEKRDIEDDANGVAAFAAANVAYHF